LIDTLSNGDGLNALMSSPNLAKAALPGSSNTLKVPLSETRAVYLSQLPNSSPTQR
jgi:hypothetical protein